MIDRILTMAYVQFKLHSSPMDIIQPKGPTWPK